MGLAACPHLPAPTLSSKCPQLAACSTDPASCSIYHKPPPRVQVHLMRTGKEEVPGRQTIPSFSCSAPLYSDPSSLFGDKDSRGLSPPSAVQIQRSSLLLLQPFPKDWPCLRVSLHALPSAWKTSSSPLWGIIPGSPLGLSSPRTQAPPRGPVLFIHSPPGCVITMAASSLRLDMASGHGWHVLYIPESSGCLVYNNCV